MQVQIKFIVSGANSAIGGFAPGDTARVDAAFAKHLVDEAKCAVYTTKPVIEKPVEAVKPVKKQSKG